MIRFGTSNGEQRAQVFRSHPNATVRAHGHNCIAHVGSPLALALALVAAGASDRILGKLGMMP